MMAGLVLLMFAGMFGFTIMPYVFEVVTRVIRVARVVKGLSPLMYVDDAIGASRCRTYIQDMEAVGEQIKLLGSEAEAKEKR